MGTAKKHLFGIAHVKGDFFGAQKLGRKVLFEQHDLHSNVVRVVQKNLPKLK